MNLITLNNGVKIPQLGFGVYQIPKEETKEAVYQAIKIGYRLIDTAILYGNEKETGEGIQKAILEGIVSREELFVTTKLFIQNMGEQNAKESIKESLFTMNLDYMDLFLIHQPYGDVYGAWRSLANAQEEGKIRAIGISNFDSAKMIEFVKLNDIAKPQVNQIEVNPWYQRQPDLEWHQKYDVKIEAWSPFARGKNNLFTNSVLKELGDKYNKSVSQVVLRWLIQKEIVALAKSTKPERMEENINIFDFNLSDDDMKKISSLDKKESAFFDHHDPSIVEWFISRI